MRWSECWIGFKWDSPHIRSVGSVRSVRSVVWFRAEAEDDDPRPFSGLQSVEEKLKVKGGKSFPLCLLLIIVILPQRNSKTHRSLFPADNLVSLLCTAAAFTCSGLVSFVSFVDFIISNKFWKYRPWHKYHNCQRRKFKSGKNVQSAGIQREKTSKFQENWRWGVQRTMFDNCCEPGEPCSWTVTNQTAVSYTRWRGVLSGKIMITCPKFKLMSCCFFDCLCICSPSQMALCLQDRIKHFQHLQPQDLQVLPPLPLRCGHRRHNHTRHDHHLGEWMFQTRQLHEWGWSGGTDAIFWWTRNLIRQNKKMRFKGKLQTAQTIEALHFFSPSLEAVEVICWVDRSTSNRVVSKLQTTWVGVFSDIDAAVVADFRQLQVLLLFLLVPNVIMYKVVAARV